MKGWPQLKPLVMKTPNYFLLLFAIVLLAGSCGPALYVPNAVNTPLLGYKGDFRAAIGGHGSILTSGTSLQGAVAVSDNIAVMGNAAFSNNRGGIWGGDKRKHHLIEGAVGAYRAFWPDKQQHNVARAELFGGLGRGQSSDESSWGSFFIPDSRFRGTYQRLFLQPGFGARTRMVDASFSARMSWVHFSNYEQWNSGRLAGSEQFGFATLEPVLNIAIGYKYVKFFYQFRGVLPFYNEANYYKVAMEFWGIHSNAGLVFSPWREAPPAVPAVGLEPGAGPGDNPAAGEGAGPDSTGAAGSADSAGQHIEAPAEPASVPALVVNVRARRVPVCIRDNGAPDGDVVSASFRGSYVLPEAELNKKPYCFELHLAPDEDNVLMIHSISAGKFQPNTILLQIGEGKEEQRHLLQLKEGVTEQIHLRWYE